MGSMRKLVYVFDAFCPWCFALTPIVRRLVETFGEELEFEAISGGMRLGDRVETIRGESAAMGLRESYGRIAERAGISFGEAFFKRIAAEGIRFDSAPPAIAFALFREGESSLAQLEFIHTMMGMIYEEGGDPGEGAFFLKLGKKVAVDPGAFVEAMGTVEARDRAHYDFALAKQLGAEAFPRLFLQTAPDFLHLIAKGYSDYDTVARIIRSISTGSPKGPVGR